MATVKQLLDIKGRGVLTIVESATVFEAIAYMVNMNTGSLVVLNEHKPCGIVTERDYLRRVALEGRSSKNTLVREIMSSRLVYVDLDTDIEECMALMTHRRIRHLPVLDGIALAGLISIGDIVRHLAGERERTIQELTSYIQGGYGYA